MLIIDRIVVNNFGPFKGYQEVFFPEVGTTVFYGENMRGKTSMLNAIRYALFGKILGRSSRQIELNKLCNLESSQEGEYGFKVILNFRSDNHIYELTRAYQPKKGITNPSDNNDYEENVFLTKDRNVLGPDISKAELLKIIPEQVSRFFLFDGELLQEYEELLIKESEAGEKISSAIERILGLPVVTNGRQDLQFLRTKAQKNESKAAQKDEKTRELGKNIEWITSKIEASSKEKEKYEKELESLKEKRSSIELQMKRNAKFEALIRERDLLNSQNLEIEKMLIISNDELKELTSSAWLYVISDIIDSKLRSLQETSENLIQNIFDMESTIQYNNLYISAIKSDNCPICKQNVDNAIKNELTKLIKEDVAGIEPKKEELRILKEEQKTLTKFKIGNGSELIKEKLRLIEGLLVQQTKSKLRIEEINEQLTDTDEEDILKTSANYANTVGEIKIIEKGLEDINRDLQVKNNDLKRFQETLNKVSGSELEKERKLRETFDSLTNIFDTGVVHYKELLRKRVESDATELFRKLTTEEEFDKLTINENFGLSIVHQDGTEIPLRSSGAEHIVALSLIGALQKNAPLQGPIIMDSPFGRLDDSHTKNVIKALPSMSQQIIALVYKSEMDPGLARSILKSDLKKEYEFKRISSRNTQISVVSEE